MHQGKNQLALLQLEVERFSKTKTSLEGLAEIEIII